jgi:hypothetical protein
VIGPYLADQAAFREAVVAPLTRKEEAIHVVPGSDAESHVARRFPHKTIRRVRSGLRPRSVRGFLASLPLAFQRGQSQGLDAVFHFTFRGSEERLATVTIRDRTVTIQDGHAGTADLHVTADAATWLGFLAKERSLLGALLRRRIRLRGNLRLLRAFGRCFSS